MRAALYHRVSTLDQDKTTARDELRRAAKAIGAKVVLDVEEKGSGARNDRPGLMRILEAARKHEVDAVIVWKLDRWGRSALDVLMNIRELETAGVRFVCSSQGLDVRPGGDAMGRLLLQVLAAVAEFERDLIRDRTRLGLARARQRGAAIGRPKVPRPDVEVVRSVVEHRPGWGEREIAGYLGCSRHALRDVLPEAIRRAQTATCPECGRLGRHRTDCSRAQLPLLQGTELVVEKGGAHSVLQAPRKAGGARARLETHPLSTPRGRARGAS